MCIPTTTTTIIITTSTSTTIATTIATTTSTIVTTTDTRTGTTTVGIEILSTQITQTKTSMLRMLGNTSMKRESMVVKMAKKIAMFGLFFIFFELFSFTVSIERNEKVCELILTSKNCTGNVHLTTCEQYLILWYKGDEKSVLEAREDQYTCRFQVKPSTSTLKHDELSSFAATFSYEPLCDDCGIEVTSLYSELGHYIAGLNTGGFPIKNSKDHSEQFKKQSDIHDLNTLNRTGIIRAWAGADSVMYIKLRAPFIIGSKSVQNHDPIQVSIHLDFMTKRDQSEGKQESERKDQSERSKNNKEAPKMNYNGERFSKSPECDIHIGSPNQCGTNVTTPPGCTKGIVTWNNSTNICRFKVTPFQPDRYMIPFALKLETLTPISRGYEIIVGQTDYRDVFFMDVQEDVGKEDYTYLIAQGLVQTPEASVFLNPDPTMATIETIQLGYSIFTTSDTDMDQ